MLQQDHADSLARARLTGARAVAFDVEHLFINPGVLQCHNVVAAHAAQPIDVVLRAKAKAAASKM